MERIKRKRIITREPGYYLNGPHVSRTQLASVFVAGVLGLIFMAALVFAPGPEPSSPPSLSITTFAHVPEPGTYAVVAGGMLMAFAGWRKLRK